MEPQSINSSSLFSFWDFKSREDSLETRIRQFLGPNLPLKIPSIISEKFYAQRAVQSIWKSCVKAERTWLTHPTTLLKDLSIAWMSIHSYPPISSIHPRAEQTSNILLVYPSEGNTLAIDRGAKLKGLPPLLKGKNPTSYAIDRVSKEILFIKKYSKPMLEQTNSAEILQIISSGMDPDEFSALQPIPMQVEFINLEEGMREVLSICKFLGQDLFCIYGKENVIEMNGKEIKLTQDHILKLIYFLIKHGLCALEKKRVLHPDINAENLCILARQEGSKIIVQSTLIDFDGAKELDTMLVSAWDGLPEKYRCTIYVLRDRAIGKLKPWLLELDKGQLKWVKEKAYEPNSKVTTEVKMALREFEEAQQFRHVYACGIMLAEWTIVNCFGGTGETGLELAWCFGNMNFTNSRKSSLIYAERIWKRIRSAVLNNLIDKPLYNLIQKMIGPNIPELAQKPCTMADIEKDLAAILTSRKIPLDGPLVIDL